MSVDGEGLRDASAYKTALSLAWIDMWVARVFLVLWIPHVLLSSMESLLLNRLADVLFWVVCSVYALLGTVSLVFLHRSGVRLLNLFNVDEVKDHAAFRAFAKQALKWRRP